VRRDELDQPVPPAVPVIVVVVTVVVVVLVVAVVVVAVVIVFVMGAHLDIVPANPAGCAIVGDMHVASLHTYPVKGCYRLDHGTAEVEPWGVRGDRRWMVIDVDGRMLTQREEPRLTAVHPSYLDDGALVMRTPGLAELVVAQPAGGERVDVTVWRSTVTTTLAAPAAGDWLSRALDRKVSLVWLDDPTRRRVDPAYGRDTDRVTFADGYPLLITATASLDALNDWLLESGSPEGPLPMTRFRPNVVVTGSAAWDEDGWLGRRVRVGAVVFRAAKMCSRCVVTTTDQETGERGHEPLRILGRRRSLDRRLIFGMNLIPDSTGLIAVGDPVTVQG